MALKAEYKTTFEPAHVIQPIYTGGSVSLSQDGRTLATCLGEEALVSNLDTGTHLARIEGDGEPITTLVLSPNARYLIVCSRSLAMRIYALSPSATLDDSLEARLLRTVKPHATPVVTATVDSTSSLLATGAADGAVKVWDLQAGYTTHTFHGHSGVISALHFFQAAPSVAEEDTKGKRRKSRQRHVDVEPAPQNDAAAGYRLASGGEDGKVRVWDLHRRKSVASFDAHVSVVRCLDYSLDLRVLLSASRDKTVILWDTQKWEQLSTVAVLESIESARFVMSGRYFYTGGETSRLRIWSTETGAELTHDQPPGTETDAILDVLNPPDQPFVLSVHADQTLLLHSLQPLDDLSSTSSERIPALPTIRRISGTHDEVIDLAYIGPDRDYLALATNLEDLRIISLQSSPPDTPGYFGSDVALLKGHLDIVITLSVDWSGHWLATGAKDNTAKLWRLDPAGNDYVCYATFTGHAESIGAVSLPSATPPPGSKEHASPLNHPPKFLVTGSQDKTVKRWAVPAQPTATPRALYTRKAHDKDINALATSYSPSAPLFASASQDRTVKIWDVETGEAIGVLRGHKRGVWTVAFSPPGIPALTTAESGGASSGKGMILTGSGDKTVRIWSLEDYSCLRTFEGHTNSVLKVIWLYASSAKREGRGVQVASAAGDGLVKVWDAQEGECATTLDNHTDRVWALAVKPPASGFAEKSGRIARSASEDVQMADGEATQDDDEEMATQEPLELVSGSADSTLTFWQDTSASTALATTLRATQRVEQDQELQNHIRAAQYREAIVLAIQLEHPKRLLELFTAVAGSEPKETGSWTGRKDVDAVIQRELSDAQLWRLLTWLREWNTKPRHYDVAQTILHAILRLVPTERLLRLRDRRRMQKVVDDVGTLQEGLQSMALSDGRKKKDTESVKDVLDALRAYTAKHYERLERLSEESFVLLWTLQQMDAVGGVSEVR